MLARLLNGAMLDAALWTGASGAPRGAALDAPLGALDSLLDGLARG